MSVNLYGPSGTDTDLGRLLRDLAEIVKSLQLGYYMAPGAVTDEKVAADAAIAQSKIANLIADLAARATDAELAAEAAARIAGDNSRLPLTGGTLTGPLTLPGDAVTALQAVPRQQLDDIVGAVSDVGAHLVDAVDAHDASAVSFAPAGGVAATDVQAAIVEVAGDQTAEATARAAGDNARLPLAGGTLTGPLVLPGDAAAALQAVPKQQLDAGLALKADAAATTTALNAKLALAGGTLTGAIVLPGDASTALQAVPKQQLDSGLATKADAAATTTALNARLPLAGGTMTGAIVLPADAAANLQAVPRQQLDAGLALKADAAATTSALNARALDSAVVHNTGAETIAGIKTFSAAPVLPVGALPESTVTGLVSDLAARALDTGVVHNTGAETVAGVKTFSAAPVVPAAAFPQSAVASLTTDLAAKLALAGGTMTGAIVLPGDATTALQAVPKQQLDAAVASGVPDATASVKGKLQLAGDLAGTAAAPTVPGKLALAGGTMTGAIVLAADPTANLQAATKQYVDTGVASATIPDATAAVKGKLQLAGDLGGTAAAPTVPGLATRALDSAVVHNTGAETIAGVKTFSAAPVVPAAAFPQSAVASLTTDLAARALDSAVVHNTGVETIAGVKTFSAAPAVPAAAFPESAVANLTTDLAAKLPLAGGTLTGALTLAANGSTALHAVPKQQLDAGLALKADAAATTSSLALKVDTDASTAALTTTATKTANYTAAAGEYVPVNSTAGAVTITLPTAPADGTRVAVAAVATGANPIVIVSGGADLIDQAVVPPGNSFGDTTHYRINAGRTPSDGQVAILKYDAVTDTWFARDSLLSETVVVRRKLAGDAFDRLQLIADGTVLRGDGTAAPVQAALVTQAAYVVEGVGGKHAITAYGLNAAEKTRNVGTTAFGYYALNANNSGDGCAAFGYEAMRMTTSAADVTAVGFQAFRNLQTASGGTAVGCQALYQCTTGHYNTGVGVFALAALTTGHDNTGFGTGVLQFVTSGGDNVGVGYNAGGTVTAANKTTTGNRQVLIGRDTGQNTPTQLNDIVAVGHTALCGGNNAIAIGSGVLAGAAGAVAIGRDNAGTSATTSTANDFVLGTTLHNVKVPGHLLIASGTNALPGLSFAADPNTGIVNTYDGRMDFVSNGTPRLTIDGGNYSVNATMFPESTATYDVGRTGNRWNYGWFNKSIGFWGTNPPDPRPAAVTDLASVIALIKLYGMCAP